MLRTLQQHWKKGGLLLLLAVLLVVWLSVDVSIQDMLMAQRELALHFVEHPTVVTLIYFSVFVVITALCLPGAGVLMLVGGGCMGFGLCVVVSTAASALGALLTLLAARFLFRESVEQRFAAKLQEINKGIEKNHSICSLQPAGRPDTCQALDLFVDELFGHAARHCAVCECGP
jgi:uncharacterized membrane protein YdjX (TVP38/TMEM64 family)